MASFNKVILLGNMVADPELKQTQGGLSVSSFSIAVNRKYSKESEQQTDFINCQAWRNTAEFISLLLAVRERYVLNAFLLLKK